MKFKYLVITFNVIFVIFLLCVSLMPIFLVGPGFAVNFWKAAWPIGLILLLVLISLNGFFIANYRLLRLMEREDWPALAYYLEEKVFTKKRYNSKNIRLLANSYLVMCDFPSISKLENNVTAARPVSIEKNLLVFGAAKILNGDHKGAAIFLKKYLDKGKVREEQWVRWFYGFSQMLDGDFGKAESEFMSLAAASNDALIAGLASYFLATVLEKHSLKPEECRSNSGNGSERVRKTHKNIEAWKKEAENAGTEVHTAIIRKYIDEAGEWLFINQE